MRGGSISEDGQRRRLDQREADPLKSWKVSATDRVVLARWRDYTAVEDLALARTHTPEAPWVIVRTDEGAVYTLRYGEVVFATGEELSAGGTSEDAGKADKDKARRNR